MLEVSGLTKSYGDRHALRGVDLHVDAGQIVGLLGPNGAGKTTLVSIVAGLRKADGGSVRVAGVDVAARPDEARRHLGLAPQDLGLYPQITARENLRVFGRLCGLRRKALDQRIDELATELGLAHLMGRLASEMSGGERRRLHTAIALIHRPPLLLLDEATAGADVRTRADLLDVVRKLAIDGSAVCYSTHYLPEIETLGAEVAILDGGRIIARGSPKSIVQARGWTEVILTFDGPAPSLPLGPEAEVDGSTVRLRTDEPDRVVAEVMAALGPVAGRLRSLVVEEPSLERLYLDLTDAEAADVDIDVDEVPT
jgi:ABC-2 type transport system ATP-binding protein